MSPEDVTNFVVFAVNEQGELYRTLKNNSADFTEVGDAWGIITLMAVKATYGEDSSESVEWKNHLEARSDSLNAVRLALYHQQEAARQAEEAARQAEEAARQAEEAERNAVRKFYDQAADIVFHFRDELTAEFKSVTKIYTEQGVGDLAESLLLRIIELRAPDLMETWKIALRAEGSQLVMIYILSRLEKKKVDELGDTDSTGGSSSDSGLASTDSDDDLNMSGLDLSVDSTTEGQSL
ncbi:hypothetical protein CYMTET_8574 [Cymbomonas tetramitiformis]|uniref:Uncharacterized protein n=1 Tax=Cymbomonas tetramitiformis TaxID=36881 RepID=A0AAE0LGC3_9CHLO|nr:hypothetical protein CYMTET_8574 [Cymbomonas tetramitiformis]